MQSLWILVSSFLFSLMGVFVKLASDEHNAWEILFWRSLFGLAFLVPVIRRMQGGLVAGLRTKYWSAHVVRNISGTIAVSLWFVSIAHLPLATSTTLNYTSSLFIGLGLFVSAAWSGRGFTFAGMRQGPMFATLLMGFGGIVLVLRPSIARDEMIWALVALCSGLLAAVAMTGVRALGRLGEPSSRTVFYFTLSGFAVALAGMLIAGARWPDPEHMGMLVAVGVTAVLAQLALTRAYGAGQMLLAANLTYAGIVFANFWGWLFWGDRVQPVAALGMLLVIAAGVASTWLTAAATARATAHP